MTSASETGQVTGTKDKDYNISWFTEACLSNALRLESHIQDAERDGDGELADFFRRAQAESRRTPSRASSYWASGWGADRQPAQPGTPARAAGYRRESRSTGRRAGPVRRPWLAAGWLAAARPRASCSSWRAASRSSQPLAVVPLPGSRVL
jgi:hypothetical protein